jgi:hypothetical protein
MCGDVDEDQPGELEGQLYLRFLSHARTLLAKHGRSPQSGDDLSAYMDKLFADALSRSARDGEQTEEAKRYQRLAAQPLVFARLAGFLAAHVALQEDPLRKVMEALMLGYAEAEQIEPDHGHDHDHGHEHGHSHGHDHHH